MSVLSFPRIIVNGDISWDPATTNNGLGVGYAKDPVKIDLPAGVEMDDYDDWLTSLDSNDQTNGGWNVFGTHHVVSNATATNFVSAPGENTTDDPMAGAPLQFVRGAPKLVDTNPYSPVTSQIFLNEMICQANGIGFSGPAKMRMTSRRPFFQRNLSGLAIAGGMGVVWQTCIDESDIAWIGDAPSDSVVGQLKAQIDAGNAKGLMLRFSAYSTLYFPDFLENGMVGNSDTRGYKEIAALWEKIKPVNPGNVAGALNPAISSLTGAIGLWHQDELVSVPSGRVFNSIPTSASETQLGAAEAQVNASEGVVSFDLMNTMPLEMPSGSEQTRANIDTVKDLGAMNVFAQQGSAPAVQIGTIASSDYTGDSYKNSGGIVDVQLNGNMDPADLATASLSVASATNETTPLTQIEIVADVDARGVYVNDGSSQSFTVNVHSVGAPLPLDLHITAQVLESDSITTVALTGGSSGTAEKMSFPVTNGTAEVTFTGEAGGTCLILVEAYTGSTAPVIAVNQGLPFPWTGYAAVRVLPTDAELNNVSDAEVTWDYVYKSVLRPFDLVYRGMSCGVFDLGDENSVKAHASQIASLTNQDKFDSPLYMPVTRDLSTGRRALLMRFLGIKETPPTS